MLDPWTAWTNVRKIKYACARALAVRADLNSTGDGAQLTVVTNALNIANELLVRSGMKIVVAGGVVRPQSFELVGPLGGALLREVTLDVALLGARPKRRFLLGLPKVFEGTHVDVPQFVQLRGREVTFEADRPFAAYADGDPIAELPVTIRVVPRSLKVLVP